MEAIAKHKKLRMSPRKARLVVDAVRRMDAARALGVLKYIPNKAAYYVHKLILSAMANLEQQQPKGKRIKPDEVLIKEIYVGQGSVLKRIRPAPRGRAHPIRKPSCHISIKIAWQQRQTEKTKPRKKIKEEKAS